MSIRGLLFRCFSELAA